MNILIVHNYYKIPGGEDTVVYNEKKLLEQNGNSVFLYTKTNEELDSFSFFKKLLFPLNMLFSLRTYKDIRKIIIEKKIEIVHVHNTVCLISPSVYYAAFSKKVPVVQTIHNFRLLCIGATLQRNNKICEECVKSGLFHGCKYKCYRQSFLQSFALAFLESFHKMIGTYKKINFICLTEFNKNKLLSINGKKNYIGSDRVYVKPNFVERRNNVVPWNMRNNQIVYVGRLDKTKGIMQLFEAWKKIDKYELIVCGVGPEYEWCENYIKTNKISNIKLIGFIENSKAMNIISKSKALIIPTQWYEGFPMVLVEAFACGTPVLGSKIGNVGSIIVDGINGLHFDQADPDDICLAVDRVFDMVDSTFECSRRLYSSEANYTQLIKIYEGAKEKND